MSCSNRGDVRIITRAYADGSLVHKYYDLRTGVPIIMTKAQYDVLDKVKCPDTTDDWEPVCLMPIGLTDPTLMVEGTKTVTLTTTYRNVLGVLDTVNHNNVTLRLSDGTDVTQTHEVVACDYTDDVVIATDVCGGVA